MNFEALNKAIAEEYEVSVDVIQPDADIRTTLDLDSMRAMSMIVLVKRHCGVLLQPRILPRFTTFASLYQYVLTQDIGHRT